MSSTPPGTFAAGWNLACDNRFLPITIKGDEREGYERCMAVPKAGRVPFNQDAPTQAGSR